MKLTEEQNYNEIAVQSDPMSDIVQKLNEISKKLGLIHRHLKSSYRDEYEDEDEDEDLEEDDEDDEDEDDLDELDW